MKDEEGTSIVVLCIQIR